MCFVCPVIEAARIRRLRGQRVMERGRRGKEGRRRESGVVRIPLL